MAGSHPGPAKGHGGRPRKKGGSRLAKGENKGYIKVTVGPKGKGHQYYKHRVVKGVTHAGKNVVVDHEHNNKSDDDSKDLQVVSRGENTAYRNRDYAGGHKHNTSHTPKHVSHHGGKHGNAKKG